MKFIHINSGISHETISKKQGELADYIKNLKQIVRDRDYSKNEASLCLVDDFSMLNDVKKIVERKKSKNLKYIINIGIGGSYLGTKALYDSVYGSFDLFQTERYPKIIFLDTTDVEYINHFISFFKKENPAPGEMVINIISKSGGTTETATNGEMVLLLFKDTFKNWQEYVVVTTDKNSPLWNRAISLGIDVLEIQKNVGGRYSVFSAVGLFPLALCGFDIEGIMKSATAMRDRCLKDENNGARESAIILFEHSGRGIAINDNFYFHMELESLGKWYRQLMGESTGKSGKGLTPTVSIGSVDLHSVVQLYLGGPKNKYTSFIYTNTFDECGLPKTNLLTHIQGIEGRSVGDIMGAIQQGTIKAYEKTNLPYSEIILESVCVEEIAAYMQFKMIEMMFLGKLMNINAFDQPQVELYKIETKKILAEK
ncbi:MAG: hypothetical protein WA061_04080 [Microgenomates group bacterium]